MHYADTSAIVRCYLPDELDHVALRALLLDGDDPAVTSELTRVELASAASAARRDGRIGDPDVLLDRFDVDCEEDGPFGLLAFDSASLFPEARRLLLDHALWTLDALHLAVVTTTVTQLVDEDDDEIVVVTRDDRQAAAARALDFTVA